MFIISSESFSDFPFDCDIPRETVMDQVVVTGTHSAGKTSLLEDYGTQTKLLEEVTGYKVPANFSANYEYAEGMPVPVVIAPEAATYYADTVAKNNRVVTDQYTVEHQIGIESVAKRLITRAQVVAAHLAHRLQPDPDIRPRAIVVSDRSQLDGHVYSRIRTPNAEQELIDMAHVALATGGKAPKNYVGHAIPYREDARQNAADSLGIAFIADHSEILFNHSEYRVDDIQLRDKIAHSMIDYYETVLGSDRLVRLSGNRIERLETFSAHLRMLARSIIAAEYLDIPSSDT